MTTRNQPRRAAKVDTKAAQNVAWLREAGAYVIETAGTWDAIVGYGGRWDVVDWKSYGAPITQSQAKAAIEIASMQLPPPIFAETAQDVLDEMRRRAKCGSQ